MLDNKLLEKFESKYNNDIKNIVIENAIAKVGINDSSIRNSVVKKHNFVFSDEIKLGDITNQKQSGRCWMFSGLNVLRVQTIKELNVETFEYSQCYLQFYDKLEKANTFLEHIDETKDLPITDRLVEKTMWTNISDGGYWTFFVGLVTKYGLVPKECMPETFHSSNTSVLNEMLDVRLKKAASEIRKTKDSKKIKKIKENTLYEVYNICVKALGLPPKTVEYEFRDKDKKYFKISGITPLEFMEKYAPKDILEKFELVDDPRKEHEKGRIYKVPYTASVLEYGDTEFLTVPLEELKKAAIKSIKDGVPVWFGCDVGRLSDRQLGILDADLYDYDNTLTEIGEFTKEDRLVNFCSFMTHAMTFTGVDLDENGNPVMWKVENSWGDKVGKKGIFSMSDKWFNDHTYSVVVDKKYISKKYLKAFEKEVITLDINDPLG